LNPTGGVMSQGNLLVVDDESAIRELFYRYLSEIGFDVKVASCGEDAINLVSRWSVHVALVDLRLPGIDGLSFVRQLRKKQPEAQIVIVSGVGELEDAIEAIKEQVCYYLRKPPALTELGQTVRLAMDRYNLAHQNRVYQEELEASERKYRNLVENSRDILIRLTPHGLCMFVGERVEQVFGFPVSDFYRYPRFLFKIMHPDDAPAVEAQIQLTLRRKAMPLIEYRVIKPDGRVVWISQSIHPVLGRNSQCVALEGVATDVTEKKRLEAKSGQLLKQIKRRVVEQKFLYELSQSLESCKDLDNWLRQCCRALPKAYQYPDIAQARLIFGSKTITSGPFRKYHTRITKDIELKNRLIGRIEVAYRKKARFLQDERRLLDTVASKIALAVHRLELEAELKASEREIRAKKAFIEEIIENVNLFVVGFDLDHRINIVNRLAETISGYKKDDLLGHPISMIFPNSGLPFLEFNRRRLGIHENRLRMPFEFPIKTKSGETIDFLWTESHVLDDSGKMTGWIGFGEDLTEKKALERKLILSEKLAATGRLAAAVAHEINNPLQGIKSNFNLIVKHLREDFEDTFRIPLVSEGLNRIAAIVQRLLDVHRPRSVEIGDVDLPALVYGVYALLEPTCRDAEIRLEQTWPEEMLPVRGFYSDLHQVFLNLMLNAIDAMPRGGKITIAASQDAERTVVLFSDTGGGIADDDIDYIFEPFFSTKKDSKGMGLGLAVVRGILESLDSEIDVVRTNRRGTCFQITLPTNPKHEELKYEISGADFSRR
jgi:PAS domain S-box-containing protein